MTQKTSHKFSGLALDQIHEQLNAMVKGDGGVLGITENEAALHRWMVAGPELARILNDYDAKHSAKRKESDQHHEQIPSIQKAFAADVKNVVNVMDVMDEMGNPFSENSKDLFPLESKVIMSDEVVQAVRTAEELGKSQYKSFITEHITYASTKDFYDTICKNNMPLFKSHSKNPSSKTQTKLTNVKNDVQLFFKNVH